MNFIQTFQFGNNFAKLESPKSQQVIGDLEIVNSEKLALENPALLFQIPWGHHIIITQKIKNQPEAIFYIKETIKNNWSRAVLVHQIESNLYERQGKAVSNFQKLCPNRNRI